MFLIRLSIVLLLCCSWEVISFSYTYKISIHYKCMPCRLKLLQSKSNDENDTVISKKSSEEIIKSIPPPPPQQQQQQQQKQQHENKQEYEFDSLDVILNKARKRKMTMFPYRIQSIANKPVINIWNKARLTVGDCMLILFATKLGSIGFCFGYVIGKSTTWLLRQNGAPIIVVEIWTVLLAIVLDVMWDNIF